MVESQMGDTPVYSVVQMMPGSTSRILHRNMLHPARSILPVENDSQDEMQDQNGTVPTEPSTPEPLTALAKANALMNIYFSD